MPGQAPGKLHKAENRQGRKKGNAQEVAYIPLAHERKPAPSLGNVPRSTIGGGAVRPKSRHFIKGNLRFKHAEHIEGVRDQHGHKANERTVKQRIGVTQLRR